MLKKPSKSPEKYVLELPVDYKYFDMIVYEGKREEYRDIKPYWEKRLVDYKAIKRDYQALLTIAFLFFRFPPVDVCKEYPRGYTHVRFRRGYSKVTAEYPLVDIHFGEGRPEWGGVPGKRVFVIAFKDSKE